MRARDTHRVWSNVSAACERGRIEAQQDGDVFCGEHFARLVVGGGTGEGRCKVDVRSVVLKP